MARKGRKIRDTGQDADRSDRESAKPVQLDPETERRDRPTPSGAPEEEKRDPRPPAAMSDD